MDLASLEIFRSVVEEGGITRAATRLHRVQSNVTTRIRQLEASLGVKLFLRDGKRMVLTPAGQTLFDYARRVLDLAEEARQAVLPARPQGRLRIASMESTAASRLPAVLAAYHQAWPDVELELVGRWGWRPPPRPGPSRPGPASRWTAPLWPSRWTIQRWRRCRRSRKSWC